MSNMTRYYVELSENMEETFGFNCEAEDKEHAISQAKDAYPDAKAIFSVQTNTQNQVIPGTVIRATLKNADLLEAFSKELEQLASKDDKAHQDLIGEAKSLIQDIDFDDPMAELPDEKMEEGSEIVNDLIDAINDYAPEGYYFGTLEGDASDFGWWQDIDDSPSP